MPKTTDTSRRRLAGEEVLPGGGHVHGPVGPPLVIELRLGPGRQLTVPRRMGVDVDDHGLSSGTATSAPSFSAHCRTCRQVSSSTKMPSRCRRRCTWLSISPGSRISSKPAGRRRRLHVGEEPLRLPVELVEGQEALHLQGEEQDAVADGLTAADATGPAQGAGQQLQGDVEAVALVAAGAAAQGQDAAPRLLVEDARDRWSAGPPRRSASPRGPAPRGCSAPAPCPRPPPWWSCRGRRGRLWSAGLRWPGGRWRGGPRCRPRGPCGRRGCRRR